MKFERVDQNQLKVEGMGAVNPGLEGGSLKGSVGMPHYRFMYLFYYQNINTSSLNLTKFNDSYIILILFLMYFILVHNLKILHFKCLGCV